MTTSTATRPDEIEPGTLGTLARLIEQETTALLSGPMPEALARQWEGSPVPRPREDTAERSSGGRPANPTADIVLDGRRLAVRDAVKRADKTLKTVAWLTRRVEEVHADLVAARAQVERAVVRFDGEEGAA